ncbi:MAG: hypothetical protein ABW252_22480 [Polyangiales bacterium]
MRATLITVVTFVGAFAVGWASVPAPAECRQCNAKKCFHDSSCGRLCTCLFEGGKTNKKGRCVQVGDGD